MNDHGQDMSALARDLLKWEQLRRQLDELEAAIKDTVLQIGTTQTVGNVRASYSQGRRTFDYETAGQKADPGIIADYTTEELVINTDWRMVCDVAGIEPPVKSQSPPRVSLKLLA